MAEKLKEKLILDEINIKDKISIKKEICPSSSSEEACIWDEEKHFTVENTENAGKLKFIKIYACTTSNQTYNTLDITKVGCYKGWTYKRTVLTLD